MVEHVVGRVAELWRYPVKSMLGERRNQISITPRGALGDRAWALRETATGRIASAKRFPQLLAFHARYEVEPTFAAPGRIEISLPDGRTIRPDDPDASAIISDVLGHSVRLENQPASDEKTGIDRDTVFGDVPVNQMKAEWTPESMPDYFQLMTGTFLEIGAVFILASGSVDHLRKLQGGTAKIDRRRFPAHGLVRDLNARPTRSSARLEHTSDCRAAPSWLPRSLRDRDQARVAPSRRSGVPRGPRDGHGAFHV